VDFLVATGNTVWQTLPLSTPHHGLSPYQCLSAHAGNPRLISPEPLIEKGWIAREWVPTGTAQAGAEQPHHRMLGNAFERFRAMASAADRESFAAFTERHAHWLEDYVLYVTLREMHHQQPWTEWPVPLRDRDPAALARAGRDLRVELERERFAQYVFFHQWEALKRYANDRGVLIFGDMPIFVSHDSADVWAILSIFNSTSTGSQWSRGADYFPRRTALGNPLYRWSARDRRLSLVDECLDTQLGC
jgi:4-alpha-glucanotransferase